ncbi:MAG: transcriptional regulator, MarR family [Frankiales bacterium]|nr:transcriptional regulator, MarR family [Frankiales bacterium]
MDIPLGRLALAYRSAMQAHLREQDAFTDWGLRPPSIGTLKVVAHHGPISQREVSERLGVHPSDMVKVVDQLEEYGLVTRVRAEGDRRRYDLTLTVKGELTLDRFNELAREVDKDFYAVLTKPEQKQLEKLMAKLVAGHFAQ